MKIYRHSGTLGDLIYSLSIVKKMSANNAMFLVALNNIENCLQEIKNKLNVEQTTKLKTYLGWAGVIIATLSSVVAALIVRASHKISEHILVNKKLN